MILKATTDLLRLITSAGGEVETILEGRRPRRARAELLDRDDLVQPRLVIDLRGRTAESSAALPRAKRRSMLADRPAVTP